MTGATSGFGAHTARFLAEAPDTRVIVGARGTGRRVSPGVRVLPLELESLASVRAFVASLIEELDGASIHLVLLNAGIRGADAESLSADGFGRTFAVNHLSHHLLSRLLLPHLAEGARVVVTSSNMHDPPFRWMAPTGLDLEAWAHPSPGGSGTGMKAYCASKLCNLMMAQSLARLDTVKARGIEVIAFNPGLTGGVGGTGASVVQKALFWLLTHTLFAVVGLFRSEFVMNTPEHSGRMLAELALGRLAVPGGRAYVSLVRGEPTFPDPSALARDQQLQDRLWRESARMVGEPLQAS